MTDNAIATRDNSILLAKIDNEDARREVAALVRLNREQQSSIEALKAGRVDIRVLTGSECFIKTDSDGCMQGFRGVTELSYRESKIYTVDGYEEDGQWWSGFGQKKQPVNPLNLKWHLTGAGAADLAGIMSVNIVYEHTPGEENPKPIYSPDHTAIHGWTHRVFAIGRDKAGNWRVERLVLTLFWRDEFLETLASKAKRKNMEEAIRFGIRAEFEDDNGKLPRGHKWEPIDGDKNDSDSVGYLCDLKNWEVKALWGGMPTRRKNSGKKNYTVVRRLIFSSWFGVGTLPVYWRGNDIVAQVKTFGYRSPLDQDRMYAFARHVNEGGSIGDFFNDGRSVKVVDAEVDADDLKEVIREEAEISEGEDSVEPERGEPPQEKQHRAPTPGPAQAPQEPDEPEFVKDNPHAEEARQIMSAFDREFGDGAAFALIEEKTGICDIEGVLVMGSDTQVIGLIQTVKKEARERQNKG